jgi:DNA-binding transcriptional regulator YhcF (GntR family)
MAGVEARDAGNVMSDIVEKWGEPVAERGFAQIPNYLLLANQFLDPRLSPVELLVLIQLTGTWWRKADLPFPSVATLATRCGVSGRQVQRAIAQLEKRELLKRVPRRSQGIIASNAYDLAPLVTILERIAKAFPNAFPRKTRALVEETAENIIAPSQKTTSKKRVLIVKRRSIKGDAQ